MLTKINNIVEIKNLFNNYEYMTKNKEELKEIKTLLINIINELDNYKSDSVFEWIIRHQNNFNSLEQSLYSRCLNEVTKLFNNCHNELSKFNNFLNQLNIRINTLNINKTEFTNEEKIRFYDKCFYHIEQNQVELFEQLLNENLIDVNIAHQFDLVQNINISPLIVVACKKNNLNIVKILYKRNANLNIGVNNGDNISPLLAATINNDENNKDIIMYLLKNGASPNFVDRHGRNPLNKVIDDLELYEKMIKKYGANVNLQYRQGTILTYACKKYKFDAIKILLKYQTDVNIVGERNYTALHYLFSPIIHEGQIEDIKIIIDLFIANNFNFNHQNNDGDTILHHLVYSTWGITIIKYLLNKNINYNVNLLNSHKNSVIHNLLNNYRYNDIDNIIEIINWFIKHKFEINCINNLGDTILHVAVKMERNSIINWTIIEYLIKNGANMNISNYDGKSACQLAKQYKNFETLKVMSKNF